MRTIWLILGFAAFTAGIHAQSIMDKLYDKYSGAEGYTSVYISKYMFEMFQGNQANINMEDEMAEVISKLDCIKILATDDDPATKKTIDLYTEMMKLLPSSAYKEVMVVKESDQNVNMYVKEDKEKVVELLMVVGGADENVLISIQGDIDMKNIAKLASTMNIEGMENLEKIGE
ncbi:MAG: DUF4252 domain-containing protein [Bacteroidales bacterium]|nr:DUF4252 domain-containing protein [Bacteroidales bacterium]